MFFILDDQKNSCKTGKISSKVLPCNMVSFDNYNMTSFPA